MSFFEIEDFVSPDTPTSQIAKSFVATANLILREYLSECHKIQMDDEHWSYIGDESFKGKANRVATLVNVKTIWSEK